MSVGKCPVGEVFGRGSVRSGKCSVGEVFGRGSVRSGKCPDAVNQYPLVTREDSTLFGTNINSTFPLSHNLWLLDYIEKKKIFKKKLSSGSTLMGLNFAGIKFRGWRLPRNSNISRGFNFADGLLSDFSRISRMGTPDFWWISRMGLQYFLNAKLGY